VRQREDGLRPLLAEHRAIARVNERSQPLQRGFGHRPSDVGVNELPHQARERGHDLEIRRPQIHLDRVARREELGRREAFEQELVEIGGEQSLDDEVSARRRLQRSGGHRARNVRTDIPRVESRCPLGHEVSLAIVGLGHERELGDPFFDRRHARVGHHGGGTFRLLQPSLDGFQARITRAVLLGDLFRELFEPLHRPL
jgi:hypothetical protein